MSDRSGALVTVVVPTYGRPEFLPDAIESVAAQSYAPIELVVVDDYSPEPVAPLVESLVESLPDGSFASVRCLRHEENRGANAARNTGIEAGGGEYVAFLDDDDYWRPEKIERQVRRLEESAPDVAVAYTALEITDADGGFIGLSRPGISGDVTRALLEGRSIGSFSRVLVRADAIDAVGPLDERFPSWQDREWYLRLSRRYRFAYLDEPLVVGRVDDHEQISDDFESKRDISYPLLIEKHRSLAASYGRLCERRFLAVTARSLGFSALKTGHRRAAIANLLRSLWRYPLFPKTYLYLALALGGRPVYRRARRLKSEVVGRTRR